MRIAEPSKADRVRVIKLLARHGKADCDGSIGGLFTNRNDALPPELIIRGLLGIQQVVPQESDGLNEIRLPGSTSTNKHRDGVQVERDVTNAFEVSYCDPLDHKA